MAFINLYPLLVEGLFGGLLLAGIGIAVIIVITGMIARMSMMLILTILFAFLLAYGIGYVGALVAVPAFFFAGVYMSLSMFDWWLSRR